MSSDLTTMTLPAPAGSLSSFSTAPRGTRHPMSIEHKSGFGGRAGFGEKPCLLIIDMNKAFTLDKKNDLRDAFCGTGPYTVKERVIDQYVELKRFDGYWRQGADGKSLPYLDGLIYPELPDEVRRGDPRARVEGGDRADVDRAHLRLAREALQQAVVDAEEDAEGLGGPDPGSIHSREAGSLLLAGRSRRTAATMRGSTSPEGPRTTIVAKSVSAVGSGLTSITGTRRRAASIG